MSDETAKSKRAMRFGHHLIVFNYLCFYLHSTQVLFVMFFRFGIVSNDEKKKQRAAKYDFLYVTVSLFT